MFNHFIIKIFAKFIQLSGIIFRKRRLPCDHQEIRRILINKTDRIGDAVVTLPLLLELNKVFDVTVFSSRYNDFFLKEFLHTEIAVDKPLEFSGVIRMLFRRFLFLFEKSKETLPKYDMYLDLDGIKELNVFLKVKERKLCKYYVSFNMGIWNLFLQYSHPGYSVLFSRKHILDSYKDLIKAALGVNVDIPDYIDLSSKMVPVEGFDRAGFILVNIGGAEKFRGPSPDKYAEIINRLDFNGEIVVMDEIGRPHIEEFKKHINKNNITYLNKDYSVWELLFIASKSKLYVGADSGITQLLQIPVNAFIFFGTGSPQVWKPYSKNVYVKKKIKGTIIEETRNSQGITKKIAYKPVWCRPCFDLGCRERRCLGFDVSLIVQEIESMALSSCGS